MKAKKLGSRSDTQPSHALSRYVNGSGALPGLRQELLVLVTNGLVLQVSHAAPP